VGEEKRLAQGRGSSDAWPDDAGSVKELRAEVADLFPGDKAMAARVERLIETVKADRVAAEVVEPVPQKPL
jgi:hypothetical protein